MPIPETPRYFPPQEERGLYAAQGALFLVDPARVHEIAGEAVLDSDLIRALTRKSYPHDLYREGAIVSALGVEEGHYTITVRSTETEDAPMPLSHMVFSAGFVLGTETGELLLCNTDRLQHWSPGQTPKGEDHPLSSYERPLQVAPGWYQVTVIAGIAEPSNAAGEEWVCAFLLAPQPSQPAFTADLQRTLTF